ncbi:unnamed protein product [Cylicocyclus nassatus]|uniref:SCP domain-containing protein n=1 Tax=Cylicocyclus nassatus TaxID=53992 RepID=A0AA36H0F5_CYLNA|nr:unnamed protein product [Cylicocyclus nassatus]
MLWLLYIAAVHISASSASEGEEVTSSSIGISLSPNAQIPETTLETNIMCPGSIGMTDELRLAYLDFHNSRRSLLASGQAEKNDGTKMPGAKNMLMLFYDCKLERSALQYAGQCPKIGSDPSSRGEQGENFYQLTETGENFLKAAQKSSRSWYSVVTVYPGLGKLAKYRANHVGTPITTFTQMVWAVTRRMGCSVVHCPPFFTSVCRYNPAGNVVGETVYDPGETCTACPSETTCRQTMGLCN